MTDATNKVVLTGPTPFDEGMRSLFEVTKDPRLALEEREEIHRNVLPLLKKLQNQYHQRLIDSGELVVIPVVNYGNAPDGTIFTLVPSSAIRKSG